MFSEGPEGGVSPNTSDETVNSLDSSCEDPISVPASSGKRKIIRLSLGRQVAVVGTINLVHVQKQDLHKQNLESCIILLNKILLVE